jgi:CRISPR-associated protein Csb2
MTPPIIICRESNIASPSASHRTLSLVTNALPKVARFAISSTIPPSITQSLSLAERFHQGFCSKLRNNHNSPLLTGRDNNGNPLTGNTHAYFLPECDQHGYVTHMTLHASGGFDEAACYALGKLRQVWDSRRFDATINLLAIGQSEDSLITSPYFHKSKTWISLTPFIPVRHPKATHSGSVKTDAKRSNLQIGSPEHDCWRLLEKLASEPEVLGYFPVMNVALMNRQTTRGTHIAFSLRDIPCQDFQRNRWTGTGTRAGNRGYALRLEFEKEVSMPFGLGYAAHFGLGLFQPITDSETAQFNIDGSNEPVHNRSKL